MRPTTEQTRPLMEQANQFSSEDPTGQHVDDEIAGVVRHTDLLYDSSRLPVPEMTLPLSVGLYLLRRHAHTPVGEAVVDRIGDRRRNGGGDEVEGHGEQHNGRRRRGRGLVVGSLASSSAAAAVATALTEEQVLFVGRQLSRLADDADVQDEDRQRNDAEDEQFGDVGPDGPQRPDAVDFDLRTDLTVAGAVVVVPEVRLDDVQRQRKRADADDDEHGPARIAEALALERIADGDESLDGESENEERAEVLRRQEEDRKDFAQHREAERRVAPGRLQFEEEVEDEKDEVGGRQGRQVAAGRGTHARLDPDDERQQVARETDGVPDGGDEAIDDRNRRMVDGVEIRKRTAFDARIRQIPLSESHDRKISRKPVHLSDNRLLCRFSIDHFNSFKVLKQKMTSDFE